MSDAFTEVEEEVRRDRYMRWMRQFGPWIGGALALVLIGVGGWQAYEGWRHGQARTYSNDFSAAQEMLTAGDAKGAVAALQALDEGGPAIYRQLAELEAASALVAQGDLQGALTRYDAAAAAARDPIVRDTARLRAAYLVADSQDFPAVQARVAPIIEAGGPIGHLARELLAIEAWEAGEFALARSSFDQITLSTDAPEAMQQRARLALAVLGPAAPRQAGAAPAQQSNAPEAPRGEAK